MIAALIITLALGGVRPSAAAPPEAPAGELSGTWHGSFGQVAASLYVDEGKSVVRVADNGTFTATVTPGFGANNLAKPSQWTGSIVQRGKLISFQTPGPWLTLSRAGDTLYGVTTDPMIGAVIMVRLEREGTRAP